MFLSDDRNPYGPMPKPDANDGYGDSPADGSGRRVASGSNLSTNEPLCVGWTALLHGNAGIVRERVLVVARRQVVALAGISPLRRLPGAGGR